MDKPDHKDQSNVGDVVKIAIAFVIFILAMYWSWNFVGPSGQTSEIGSFILFWLREIILFGILGIALVAAGLLWVLRFFRSLMARDKNEL